LNYANKFAKIVFPFLENMKISAKISCNSLRPPSLATLLATLIATPAKLRTNDHSPSVSYTEKVVT